jgi:hypothetical protein
VASGQHGGSEDAAVLAAVVVVVAMAVGARARLRERRAVGLGLREVAVRRQRPIEQQPRVLFLLRDASLFISQHN